MASKFMRENGARRDVASQVQALLADPTKSAVGTTPEKREGYSGVRRTSIKGRSSFMLPESQHDYEDNEESDMAEEEKNVDEHELEDGEEEEEEDDDYDDDEESDDDGEYDERLRNSYLAD